MGAGYDEAAVERYVPELGSSARSPFQRDRARLVHSASLRRLAGKTQVVGPSSDAFIRNRLTHSLEVAQVGRELATSVGCDPDLVEAACLAHDLGHPPFGHNGERSLDELAGDIGGFEGNAQTFRILTRLEAKRFDEAGRSAGLNLSRATLDAASKYPWPRSGANDPPGAGRDRTAYRELKFGVYEDDLDVFVWMRKPAEPRRVCIEAQIMDFADDVAYSVHDVEDAIVGGRIDLSMLVDPGLRAEVFQTAVDWYLPGTSPAAVEEAYRRLSRLSFWPQSPYDGSRRSLSSLKNLTSGLIGRFCLAAQEGLPAAGVAPVRYGADLPVPPGIRQEIALLKGIAAHLVMRAADRLAVLDRQRVMLAELADSYWRTAPATLEPALRADFEAAASDPARRRVVVDQVASLTDLSATAMHERLRSA
ncbi:MAG TPA: deoxyguanosinetriphosphate triphosphohydrolase [Nocardioidaceae bacterium]|nr:deoxyguanosinetriphosphate triphosphohydrolase [Nocardioidaceae bacterium]